MSDYNVRIGTELDTKGIDTGINKYHKKKSIEFNSKLDTSGIDKKIASYKAKKPIEVDVKLNTTGIAKKIGEYKVKTPVKVDAKLNTKNIDTAIGSYKTKKFIEVNAKLNSSSINEQIRNYKAKNLIKVDAKLNDRAIDTAIQNYKPKQRIRVALELNAADINEKIRNYEVSSPLRVKVKINKTDINQQIRQYDETDQYITVKAKLDSGAISQAIKEYKTKTPIKVDLVLDHTDIDNKVGKYAKTPVQINAKLKLINDINAQVKKYKISVPINLTVKQFDTSNIEDKIKGYTTKSSIKVGVKLDSTGINNQLKGYKTNTPLKVVAELDTDSINSQIKGYKTTTPIKVALDLDATKINEKLKNYKIGDSIEVNIRLDNKSIGEQIRNYLAKTPIRLSVELDTSDIEEKIRGYKASVPIKVGVKLDSGDISNQIGKHKIQAPIHADVKLDTKDIVEQIKNYKTKSSIRVGVKLDVQKINEQIRKIKTRSLIKVGIKLDTQKINEQIRNFNTGTPIKLGVELDESNVWAQIDNIKRKLQELGNVRIDFGAYNNIQDEATKKKDSVRNIASGGSYVSNTIQELKEADIVIKATKDQIANLEKALKTVGFNDSSIESITSEFKELGIAVTNITSRLNADGSVKLTVKGLDQFKDAVTYVNNIKADGSLGAWSETISSDINKVAENFNKLKSLANDIGNLKIDLFKSSDADEIKRMTEELNRLQKEYNELFVGTQGGLKSNQINQLDNIAKKAEGAISKLKKEYAETRAELAKEVKTNISTGKLKNEINGVRESFNLLRIEDQGVQNDIARLQTLLGNMDSSDDIESVANDYQEFLQLLETVKNSVTELRRNQSNSGEMLDLKKMSAMEKLNNMFEEGSQAAKKFSTRAKELARELNECGNANVDNVTKKVANLGEEVKKSNLQTKKFTTRLKDQFSKYSQYLSVASMFMYAAQALRSMFEQVKLIDSAMTELKKVTDETDATYDRFLTNAASKAKEIGTTIDGLVSSTADFARLGYGFEDAQGLAEVANIYAVVGDEIEGVQGATESLISTMAAFKDEMNGMSNTDFAMSIVDIFNELGNNFAISSGGLGEALERSASSLAAANNSLHESAALITAANEVVQNPEKVGTAMKTVSMRIRSAKTEMEEMGEDTTGMVESTAKLRQEIMALSGVDIMLDANNFKSTYQIMDELSRKWEHLSDISQATIIELMAGKHQGNVFASLMQNFDTARQALETSLKSSGSAMREHEKWQQSLEARINSLKASWQSLSQTFMQSNFLKILLNIATKLIDIIESIIDKFGLIGTAISGVGLFKFGKVLIPTLIQVNSLINKAGTNFTRIGKNGAAAGKRIASAFMNLGKALLVMGAIKAVQDLISWWSKASDKAETTAEKFDRISQELSDVDSELSSLESELSNVESQIDALLAKDELTFADKEELSRLQKISSELEHQIELTEALQESLQKSLNSTSINAYGNYAKNTSFYSTQSKLDRKEEAKEMGSSIGNVAGMIIGAALVAGVTAISGGTATLPMLGAGAGFGSVAGSFGGSAIGGAVSDAKYTNETTVREMLDNMHIERIKLEEAEKKAYKAYTDNKSDKNKKSWEESTVALNEYNTALANHISQLSQYYNSIDYSLLKTDKQRDEYLRMGDDIDKYNIATGAKDAVKTALDRRFSEEFITEEAQRLKDTIQASLSAGENIHYFDIDSSQFKDTRRWLEGMGISIEQVISYFNDLKEAQADAFDYDTYDTVSNIATLSDGVAKLTDAFREFNEQGVVSSQTLVELNEIFGNSGEAWNEYVDAVTSGISSIEDVRNKTENLAESHINTALSNGIKFHKFNEESNKYEFDKENYKTYLSTINELEYLGVENAKEYLDAKQQESMIREAANQRKLDLAEKETLLSKKILTKKEKARLNVLKSKDIDDNISDIESQYGVRINNKELVNQMAKYDEATKLAEKYAKYKTEMSSKLEEFYTSASLWNDDSENKKQKDAWEKKKKKLKKEGYSGSGWSLDSNKPLNPFSREFWEVTGESFSDIFGGDNTKYDDYDELQDNIKSWNKSFRAASKERQELFDKMIEIANNADISLDGIDIKSFNPNDINGENTIYEQVYNRVKSELEKVNYDKMADELSAEIEAGLDSLGLEIDFGRNFDKIVIDGFKTKVDQINTAKSEMLSSGGLSTDSIIAIDDIFGDLSSYNSSKLFENTANGVRLNTEEFKKLNDEFKKTNINNLENKMSDLGDQYIKTREELYNLTYGTEEYNAKARELGDIEKQIAANEELMSQYKGLFSAFQEWQRAESSGSERNMYETILGGFENVGDEISRGWIDDGTKEFLELLKGDKATIIDGNGNKKEINIATASVQDLKKVWKDLDKNIKHTTHSVRDFFTVDDEGNSTSQGVYNFLDAIGQMEEENFGGKDVVKRNNEGNIIGFDFQMVGGDKAIAEALGVSEEIVQIMKRAAIDAGFVVTFDGSFEQLDVLREKAQKAAEEMNKILKADNKATIDIDMNVDSVEKIQPQLDKIMETFGKKDGNGKLTGAIDMDINGAEEAIQIASTLQSMKDKLTRPAYMDIQISQVEEELRDPLQSLQDYRTNIERLNQAKLRGADTTELETSIKTSKEKVIADLLEIQKNNPKLAGELEIKGLTKKEIEKKVEAGEIKIPATMDIQLEMDEKLGILADKALLDAGLISSEEFTKRVQVYLEAEVDNEGAASNIKEGVEEVVDTVDETADKTNKAKRKINIELIAKTIGEKDVDDLSSKLKGLDDKTIQAIAEVLGGVDVDKLKLAMGTMTDVQVQAIVEAIGKGDVDGLKTAINGLDSNTVQAIAQAFGYNDVNELNTAIENLDPKTVQAVAQALGLGDVNTLQITINNMQGNTVDAKVDTSGQKEKINTLQSWINGLKGKIVQIGVNLSNAGKKKAAQRTGADPAGNDSEVDGTANVNGTTGRAFKKGTWGTKNSGTALVGELGREVLVRDGRYYTIGNNGAEFIKYKKGDIIFNHVQSEQLFRNGKVTAGGGRAKAFVDGTALVNGNYPSSGSAFSGNAEDGMLLPSKPSFKVGYDYKASSDGDSKKSQNIFDWIEVAIERIEREIKNLDRTASNVYKTWGSRNKALVSEISKVSNEIALQESAYKGYMNAANEIGLSSEWKKKVQSGAIDIDNITDDTLKEKIDDYKKYYEEALNCKDAIEELKEQESKLYAQRFENIQTQYDGILQGYEHTESMLNEYISQAETQGHIVSKKYYQTLINNEKQNINTLKQEQADLISERDKAVADGKITKYSEEWYLIMPTYLAIDM